jgi:hypothetical protein
MSPFKDYYVIIPVFTRLPEKIRYYDLPLKLDFIFLNVYSVLMLKRRKIK